MLSEFVSAPRALIRCAALLTWALALTACSTPYEVVPPADAEPKGDRMFGINMSEGDQGFEGAYADWKQSGAEVIELNIPWNLFYGSGDGTGSTTDGFHDPFDLLASTDRYGTDGVKLALSIAVIDTAGPALPADLDGQSYSAASVTGAFHAFLDELFSNSGPGDVLAIPESVDLVSVSIGNEVDLGDLDTDAKWADYTGFFADAAAYLKNDVGYSGVVGCKTTVMGGVFGGNTDGTTGGYFQQIESLNEHADVVMLNYYPQDENQQVLEPTIVHDHLASLVAAFSSLGKPIWLMEVGYQSDSRHCGSSEEKQAQFFAEFFAAWDTQREAVETVIVDWLNDQPDWQIEEWKTTYGSDSKPFVAYLSTLGLRDKSGNPKPAWNQVLAELTARGW